MKRNLQRIGGRIKLIAFTYSQINKKIKQTINTILLLWKASTSLDFVSTQWKRVKEQNRLDLVSFYVTIVFWLKLLHAKQLNKQKKYRNDEETEVYA